MNPKYWLGWFLSLFSRKVAARCGHKTRLKGTVQAYGDAITTTLPRNEEGATDYCLDCLQKMVIRCAKCGRAIFIGDPVSVIYRPENGFLPGRPVPEYAIGLADRPNSYVGCMFPPCVDSASLRAGFWYPPGRIKGDSILELCLTNGGQAVVVGDVEKPEVSTVPIS